MSIFINKMVQDCNDRLKEINDEADKIGSFLATVNGKKVKSSPVKRRKGKKRGRPTNAEIAARN